jgi:hypothetical protein
VARAAARAILGAMSEDQDQRDSERNEEDADAPAPTPFDNPFFLPVLLWAFAVWFGWDIATASDAYRNYPRFNQYGLAGFSLAAIYFTWSAIKEKRAEKNGPSD